MIFYERFWFSINPTDYVDYVFYAILCFPKVKVIQSAILVI